MASVAVSQQLQEDLLLVSDEFKTNKPTAEGNKARLRLNEQGLKEMSKKGVYKSVINTLNSIHKRLNK